MIFPESGKSLILAFLVYFPLLISPRPMEADEESAQEDDKTGYNWDSWTSYIIPGAGVVCTIMAITLCACAACKNQVRPFLNGETPHNKAIREMLLQARSEHPNPKLAQLTKRMYDLGVRAETATRAMNSLDELTRLRIEQSELQMCGGKEAIVNEFRKAENANYEPVGVHRPVSQMSLRSPSTWSMASYQRPLPRLPLSSSSSMMNRPLPIPPTQWTPAKPPTPYYRSEEKKAVDVGNRFDEYTLYEEGEWNEYGLLKAAREAKSTCEGAAGLDKAADFDEYTVYDEGQLNLYGILKEQRRIENQVDAGCEPSSAYEDYYLDAGEFQQPSNMREIAVGKGVADAMRKEEAANKKIPRSEESKDIAAERERKATGKVDVVGVARLMEVAKGAMVVSGEDIKSPSIIACNEAAASIRSDQLTSLIEKISTAVIKTGCEDAIEKKRPASATGKASTAVIGKEELPIKGKERPASIAGKCSATVAGKKECAPLIGKERPASVAGNAAAAVASKECLPVVGKEQPASVITIASATVLGKECASVVGKEQHTSVVGKEKPASVVEKASVAAVSKECAAVTGKERPASVVEKASTAVIGKKDCEPVVGNERPASVIEKVPTVIIDMKGCEDVTGRERPVSAAGNASAAVVGKECVPVIGKEQLASVITSTSATVVGKVSAAAVGIGECDNIEGKERPVSVAEKTSAAALSKECAAVIGKERPASVVDKASTAVIGKKDCESVVGNERSASVIEKVSTAIIEMEGCEDVTERKRPPSAVEKASAAIAEMEGCEDIAEKERPASLAEIANAAVVKKEECSGNTAKEQPVSPVGKRPAVVAGREECGDVTEEEKSPSVAGKASTAVVAKEKCMDIMEKEQSPSAAGNQFAVAAGKEKEQLPGKVSAAGIVKEECVNVVKKDRSASTAEKEKCATISENISKEKSVKDYISFYENNVTTDDPAVLSEMTLADSRPKTTKHSTGSLCEELKIEKQVNAIGSAMSGMQSTDSKGLTQLPRPSSNLLSRPLPPVPKPAIEKKAPDVKKNKTGVGEKAPFDEYTVYDEGSLNQYGVLKAAKEAERITDAVIGTDSCGDDYTVYYEGAMNEYGLLKDAREARVECGTGQDTAAGFDDYTEYAKSPIDENKEITPAKELGIETEKNCDFDEYAASFSGNDRAAVDTSLQSELGQSDIQSSTECRSASEFSKIESDAISMETVDTVGELQSTPQSPSKRVASAPVFKAEKSAKRVRVRRRVKKIKSRKVSDSFKKQEPITEEPICEPHDAADMV